MPLKIEICSPPDREKLVAQIMIDHEQFAEINQESEKLVLEVYPRRDGMPWNLSLDDAMNSLVVAKARLAGRGEQSDFDVTSNQREDGTEKP